MESSLGVAKGFQILHTTDFSDEQAKAFLRSLGVGTKLPEWMPRRPLLLAYLAGRGFLTESSTRESSDLSPAAGWDTLLWAEHMKSKFAVRFIDFWGLYVHAGPSLRQRRPEFAELFRVMIPNIPKISRSSIVEKCQAGGLLIK